MKWLCSENGLQLLVVVSKVVLSLGDHSQPHKCLSTGRIPLQDTLEADFGKFKFFKLVVAVRECYSDLVRTMRIGLESFSEKVAGLLILSPRELQTSSTNDCRHELDFLGISGILEVVSTLLNLVVEEVIEAFQGQSGLL